MSYKKILCQEAEEEAEEKMKMISETVSCCLHLLFSPPWSNSFQGLLPQCYLSISVSMSSSSWNQALWSPVNSQREHIELDFALPTFQRVGSELSLLRIICKSLKSTALLPSKALRLKLTLFPHPTAACSASLAVPSPLSFFSVIHWFCALREF